MKTTTVTFAVSFYDPDRPVEGHVKTRQFPTEHQAREFIHETLYKLAPKATSVKLIQITCERKEITL